MSIVRSSRKSLWTFRHKTGRMERQSLFLRSNFKKSLKVEVIHNRQQILEYEDKKVTQNLFLLDDKKFGFMSAPCFCWWHSSRITVSPGWTILTRDIRKILITITITLFNFFLIYEICFFIEFASSFQTQRKPCECI